MCAQCVRMWLCVLQCMCGGQRAQEQLYGVCILELTSGHQAGKAIALPAEPSAGPIIFVVVVATCLLFVCFLSQGLSLAWLAGSEPEIYLSLPSKHWNDRWASRCTEVLGNQTQALSS